MQKKFTTSFNQLLEVLYEVFSPLGAEQLRHQTPHTTTLPVPMHTVRAHHQHITEGEASMTPEEREKAIKRKPWKFCRKCKCDIKSPTQYCYDCYKGHNFTASPYGLINANKAFKFVPSENR